MRDLMYELQPFSASFGPKELARHLYTRMTCGVAIVVADQPDIMLPMLRKEWLKLVRQVQRERARTLKQLRIRELSDMIECMQTLQFSTKGLPEESQMGVWVMTSTELELRHPACRTLYIPCAQPEQLQPMASWLTEDALIVVGAAG